MDFYVFYIISKERVAKLKYYHNIVAFYKKQSNHIILLFLLQLVKNSALVYFRFIKK